MSSRKESGVISGIQTKENGPIEWRRDLPSNCQLSTGLKKIITPVLAGLLESDPRKIWNFDKFFKEVDAVLSRKAVNIFHVHKAQLIKVYIHPDEKYMHLQNYIYEQTDINPDSQVILYKTSLFSTLIEDYIRASGYPTTKEDDPLFLFNRNNNNITPAQNEDLPKCNDFPTVISVETDASQAKVACSVGHQARRQIEKFSLASKLICDTVENFSKYINAELKELNKDSQHLFDKTLIFRKNAQVLQSCQLSSNYGLKNDYLGKLNSISEEFTTTISPSVTNLSKQHCQENHLKLQWDTLARDLKCPFNTRAPARAKTLVEHLRDSWQHLVRDRATRTLSYNDEQFHLLERIKIPQTLNKLRHLLEKEVYPQYEQLAEVFGDWYKAAQNIHLKLEILVSDVEKYEGKLNEFDEAMTIDSAEYLDQVKSINQKVKIDIPKNKRNLSSQNFKSCLKEYCKESSEIKDILMENTDLINKINLHFDSMQQMENI